MVTVFGMQRFSQSYAYLRYGGDYEKRIEYYSGDNNHYCGGNNYFHVFAISVNKPGFEGVAGNRMVGQPDKKPYACDTG